jgi:SAM-dependent methyltransferase
VNCDVVYPVADGIVDFCRGRYGDEFDPSRAVDDCHLAGLEAEYAGTRSRIEGFYLPLIRRHAPTTGRDLRVLDCGCGNGLSVDLLCDAGLRAWGNDVSQLRKWQWRERTHQSRLMLADGAALPFPNNSIDFVISSGVLEHVGVDEHREGGYQVRPQADQFRKRRAFVAELMRIVGPSGRIWLDFPNGAFPIDFWHGDHPGQARRHSPKEGFLPTFVEVRGIVSSIAPGWSVTALSPHGRLGFQQVGTHWYGRLLKAPAVTLLRLMGVPGFAWLARSPLNPFLVLELTPPT